MEQTKVEVAKSKGNSKIIQTITLGFAADPIARWVWPDANIYIKSMPKFAQAFGGRGFDHGSVYSVGGGKAAAMWLPPEIEPDGDAIEAILTETIEADRMDEVDTFFGQMDEYHPKAPCWYLPLIAADPAFTGKGFGATLMKHALQRCDHDGLPAYLESSNPRNISLYERHGFEIIGKIQTESSPVMTPMLRPPR